MGSKAENKLKEIKDGWLGSARNSAKTGAEYSIGKLQKYLAICEGDTSKLYMANLLREVSNRQLESVGYNLGVTPSKQSHEILLTVITSHIYDDYNWDEICEQITAPQTVSAFAHHLFVLPEVHAFDGYKVSFLLTSFGQDEYGQIFQRPYLCVAFQDDDNSDNLKEAKQGCEEEGVYFISYPTYEMAKESCHITWWHNIQSYVLHGDKPRQKEEKSSH